MTINNEGKIAEENLVLKKENKESWETAFLDLNLKIDKQKIWLSIYDKRDSFPFEIRNFPDLSGNAHKSRTHGIIIGQLLRFARGCDHLTHFSMRMRKLTTKLIDQSFDRKLLERYCIKFFEDRPSITRKYFLGPKDFLPVTFD